MSLRPHNQTDIKFTVAHGECNGFMNSRWFINGEVAHELIPTVEGASEIDFVVDLPVEIKIEVWNKNLDTDTAIDSHGNILKDKFLRVDHVHLARLPIDKQLLAQMFEIHTDAGIKNNLYFGFPSTIKFVIEENNAMSWHLKNNHYKVK
jgi:hypothetical protein